MWPLNQAPGQAGRLAPMARLCCSRKRWHAKTRVCCKLRVCPQQLGSGAKTRARQDATGFSTGFERRAEGGGGLTEVSAGAPLKGVHAIELAVCHIHAAAALIIHNAADGAKRGRVWCGWGWQMEGACQATGAWRCASSRHVNGQSTLAKHRHPGALRWVTPCEERRGRQAET